MSVKEIVFEGKAFTEKMIGQRVKIFISNNEARDPRERFVRHNVDPQEIEIEQGGLGTIVSVDSAYPSEVNGKLKFSLAYAVRPDRYTYMDSNLQVQKDVENTLNISVLIMSPDRIEIVSGG